MTNDEDDDPFEKFALSAMSAISAFAEQESAAMARRIRHKLRQHPPAGLYGDDRRHRSLWDEYCFEVHHGPTIGLERAWSDALYPFMAGLIEQITRPVAVLMTIATRYADEDFSDHDWRAINGSHIARLIRDALDRLADERRYTAGQYE